MAAIFFKYRIFAVVVLLVSGCQNIRNFDKSYLEDDCKYLFNNNAVKEIINKKMKNDDGFGIISDDLGVYEVKRSQCNYFVDFVFIPHEPGGVISFILDRTGVIISMKIGR